ncbi:MAG: hypothetical protein R2730_07100 [Chitinophagales bacterium]
MYKPLICIALVLLTFISCKEDCELDQAVITGVDYRLCICCGDFMITFSDNPEPYVAEFKLAQDLPESSGITNESDFPIYVKIDWREKQGFCENFIEVKSLEIL